MNSKKLNLDSFGDIAELLSAVAIELGMASWAYRLGDDGAYFLEFFDNNGKKLIVRDGIIPLLSADIKQTAENIIAKAEVCYDGD